jgi:hypothetical protein
MVVMFLTFFSMTASDGVWERANGEDVLRWTRNFYEERIAEAERLNSRRFSLDEKAANDDGGNLGGKSDQDPVSNNEAESDGKKRESSNHSPSPPAKRRKRSHRSERDNVADVIVRRVLNKVRRARNISSLQVLMSLPPGRARRSKHDDITATVIDLSAFVS